MVKHVVEGPDEFPWTERYGPHPLVVRLIQNQEFRASFIAWFDDHLDSDFSAEVLNAKLDEMVAGLAPYMQEHRNRWPYVSEMNNDWTFHIDLIRDFIRQRSGYVRQHLIEVLGSTNAAQEDGSGTRR